MFGIDIIMKSFGVTPEQVKTLSMHIAADFAEILATSRDNAARLARMEAALGIVRAPENEAEKESDG